ncbi:ABC transporter ATP-binding protein [Micromonospora cathayae]|uniref:ABC transporter ATP-binding protein n=1 Tax=Micromonospora cathayae TaxID=3028804 RepID=A0ABY7ZP08_9ACTN|nr:ABC transporter ATP-binding protein [Micromonospora sp. HUAS 3]WDZ83798.1 ABC transporter ATP-binding protein [Micromonospora sp. HUAS 3]
MLSVSALSSNYGNIRAVRNVSLSVAEGQLVTLLGANGSGKSTTMKTIAGFHRPVTGTVLFDGTDITGWPTHRVVRAGLAFVPERPTSVLLPLTVEENLRLSGYAGRGSFDELRDRALEVFPKLADRRRQVVGSMSGGEQQMVAVARGLMTNPKMLLIDSPVIGLSPAMADTVYEAMVRLNQLGITILFIEQSAAVALVLADHAYILNRGENVLSGETEVLRESTDLINTYLA